MSLVVWFIFRVGHYFSIVTDNDTRFVDDLLPLPPGSWPLWTLNLNLLTGNLFVSFSNTAWLETWEQWSLSWSAKVFPTSSISHKHSEIDSNPDRHYYSRKLVIVKYRKWSIESQTNWTRVCTISCLSAFCISFWFYSEIYKTNFMRLSIGVKNVNLVCVILNIDSIGKYSQIFSSMLVWLYLNHLDE